MSIEPIRVLIAVDLAQKGSEPIIDECALWAGALHAKLDVGFVNPSEPAAPHVPDRHFREIIEAQAKRRSEQDRAELASLLARLPSAVRGSARYSQGSPRDHVLSWAKDYDALILATHGRKGVRRTLLGSVAESVIRRSPVPLLVLRLAGGSPDLGGGVRILCAVDIHGAQSIERVARAGRWAEQLGASVDLLYVGADVLETLELASRDDTLEKKAEELAEHERGMLDTLLETLPEGARGKAVHLNDSRTAEAIATAAKGYDLLAVHTRGSTGLGRFFMGSVAERAIRSATVPTLVLQGR